MMVLFYANLLDFYDRMTSHFRIKMLCNSGHQIFVPSFTSPFLKSVPRFQHSSLSAHEDL